MRLGIEEQRTNADDILVDDTASTDVQVADLGVAHETLRQANGGGRGLEHGVFVLDLGEAVHDGAVGVGNGIAVTGRVLAGDTPTIDDDWRRLLANARGMSSWRLM